MIAPPVRAAGPSHSACRACGLFLRQQDDTEDGPEYFAPPFLGDTEDPELPLILVVLSGYFPEAFSEETPGGWLLRNVILDGLEGARWAVTGTLRCPAPYQNKKDMHAHRTCGMAFLPRLQEVLRPACVVLLGIEALEVGLGRHAPKSIRAASKRTIIPVDGAPPVVVGQSPWAHKPEEGYSLKDDWVELFTRAERLALGKDSATSFPYQEISDIPTAVRLCETLPVDFTFDPEYESHDEDPVRRTIWHPEAELLCWSVEWVDPAGVSRAATFVPPAAKDPRVWRAAFHNRRPCAHFAKNDFQVPFALLRKYGAVNVFDHVRRLDTGEVDFRDPGMEVHLTDQSRAGLGILSLAMDAFGVDNWKQKKDEMIAVANRQLAAQWDAWNAWSKRQGEAWADVKAWEKEDKARSERETVLYTPEAYKTTTVRAAQRWMAKHPFYPRPQEPARPPKPDRPRGTCGYSSAIPYLYHYCAEDSIHTGAALRKLVPKMVEELGGCGPLVRRLLSRITELTCMVERVGMPVDEDRVAAAREIFLETEAKAKRDLLAADPRVVDALICQQGFWEELKRSNGNYEATALRYLNPASPIFKLELARVLGVDLKAHTRRFKTDSGGPSFGKEALHHLSGDGAPWDDLNAEQQVWKAFSQLKAVGDLISKLGMFRYVVDGVIRTDYRVVKVDKADHEGAGEGDSSGTDTGRLSAGYLQGLKKDPAFRSPFIAPEGWLFLESDYSTLEPRILSHIAGIPEWDDWFNRALDLYCGMANRMYNLGVSLEGDDDAKIATLLRACIDDDERQVMKRCFLAQMYMQGAHSLAIAAGIPLAKAQEFYEYFHNTFPQLKRLQGKLWKDMLAGRPVTTPFGRQTYAKVPHTNDPDRDEKMASEHRHLWNFPVQGTGSDINLWTAWELMRKLQAIGRWGGPWCGNPNSWGATCNLVHDSQWSLVRVQYFREYALLKADTMENKLLLPFRIRTRLDVELKAGRELANLKKVDRHNPVLTEEMLAA